MSTGYEMLMKARAAECEAQPFFDAYLKQHTKRMADAAWFSNFGRECGAKRARKLRRKGHDVRPLKRRTSTGKARYTWLPCIPGLHIESVDMGPNTIATRIWHTLDVIG